MQSIWTLLRWHTNIIRITVITIKIILSCCCCCIRLLYCLFHAIFSVMSLVVDVAANFYINFIFVFHTQFFTLFGGFSLYSIANSNGYCIWSISINNFVCVVKHLNLFATITIICHRFKSNLLNNSLFLLPRSIYLLKVYTIHAHTLNNAQ